jgi:transposase
LSYKAISSLLNNKPSVITVGEICREYQRTGRCFARMGRRGVRNVLRKFDLDAWEVLLELVNMEETATLGELSREMQARLGSPWTRCEVSKALKESGFVRKKLVNLAVEADPELQAKYERLVKRRGDSAEQFVFIDEVGTVSMLPYASDITPPKSKAFSETCCLPCVIP